MSDETLKVVVDANIVIQSPRLSSSAWRAAFQADKTGAFSLCLPEVCVIEAVAWMDRALPERVKQLRRALSDLEQVGVRLSHDPWTKDPLEVDHRARQAAAGYEIYLRDRFGAARILPIPPVDHTALVRRAASRQRPFNEAGSGYRDALIWETVCKEAHGCRVILVTNNTRDFADGDDLADGLRKDLKDRGLGEDSVDLKKSLYEVVVENAPEATDARGLAEEFLARPHLRRQLEEEFAQSFAQSEGIPLPHETGDLDLLFDDPVVEAVFDLAEPVIDTVIPDGDASYLVLGRIAGTGQMYSRRRDATPQDVRSAQAGREAGRVDEYFEDHNDLVVIKFVPVIARFGATFEPHQGYVWNGGVIDLDYVDQD